MTTGKLLAALTAVGISLAALGGTASATAVPKGTNAVEVGVRQLLNQQFAGKWTYKPAPPGVEPGGRIPFKVGTIHCDPGTDPYLSVINWYCQVHMVDGTFLVYGIHVSSGYRVTSYQNVGA